jgi:hypothetical protein
MCFSATASFIAGVSLSAFGLATMKKAKQKNEIPFAMIPLLFGIQQIIEGMLWLSFRIDAPLLNVSMTYAFSLFSHVLWPIFVPFAIGSMEAVAWRRKVISIFQIIGVAVGLYLLYFIVRFPVTSEVDENIVYISPHFYKVPVMLLYLAPTCVASFFSSHRIINLFGVLAFLLFIVAYWFYTVALFSVWCFFSAILSFVIYLHFQFTKKGEPLLRGYPHA